MTGLRPCIRYLVGCEDPRHSFTTKPLTEDLLQDPERQNVDSHYHLAASSAAGHNDHRDYNGRLGDLHLQAWRTLEM